MYVIFGATGRVGRATIAALRDARQPVRAVLHDERQRGEFEALGCEVVAANLLEARDIARAIEGADAVQMLCPVPHGDRDPAVTMERGIDAAAVALQANPPKLLLALSDYGAELQDGTGITGLFHTLEQRFRAIDTHLILLRSAEHMHNWARVVPAALATGNLPSLHHPLTRPFPTVAAQDVGALAGRLLLEHGAAAATLNEAERRVDIVSIEGPQRVSANDIASAFATALARDVAAFALPRDQWLATLQRAGLSQPHAQLIVDLYDAQNLGRIDVEPDAGSRAFGTTTIAQAFGALAPALLAAAR